MAESVLLRRRAALLVALIIALAALIGLSLRCASTQEGAGAVADAGSFGGEATFGGASRHESRSRPRTDDGRATRGSRSARNDDSTAAEVPGGSAPEPEAGGAGVAGVPAKVPSAYEVKWLRSARTAPFGRFALVGGPDWSLAGLFGSSVAIDGDIAVVAAPGHTTKGWVVCGAAYVYERREHVWTPVAFFESPRRDVAGFARRVGVSGTRVAIFGGVASGSDAPVFRTYVRGPDGAWNHEAEVPCTEPMAWDATLGADVAFVGEADAVAVYRLEAGQWRRAQTIGPPPESPKARFGVWFSSLGDTLAVYSSEAQGSDGAAVAVDLYRTRAGAFAHEARLPFTGQRLFGCVAHAGASIVAMGTRTPLTIDERSGEAWVRVVSTKNDSHAMVTRSEGHPFAADGSLVVGVSQAWEEIAVFDRRKDGWYRTTIPIPAHDKPGVLPEAMWPPRNPYVAMSGRSVVVGTGADAQGDGRVWFFDITDDDLARATKIEAGAK